jgi:hypothetical protein
MVKLKFLPLAAFLCGCLIFVDLSYAKGGRGGGRSSKAGSGIAKSISRGIDSLDDGYRSPNHLSRNYRNNQTLPNESPEDDREPLIIEPSQQNNYESFPEKFQAKVAENPGKRFFNVGGVLACNCNNKILFTNLVCMDCNGSKSQNLLSEL